MRWNCSLQKSTMTLMMVIGDAATQNKYIILKVRTNFETHEHLSRPTRRIHTSHALQDDLRRLYSLHSLSHEVLPCLGR